MERRAIEVSGIVQGVGFRPFIYTLAVRLGLAGFVCNQTNGVRIEVEGAVENLDRFLEELQAHPPELARITGLCWSSRDIVNETHFRIATSDQGGKASIYLPADVATCDDCLTELFDPADRRYRYPFANCTNCGPRLTIITGAPYDRERTTMAAFPMCAACRAEYENPADRRFHAQPTACPACGPKLEGRTSEGMTINSDDTVAWFADAIRAGAIGALKGLGGYHLVCDARNSKAVATLRRRKARNEKPFALMVKDLAAAEALCDISECERDLLTGVRRPIVLLRRKTGAPIAFEVAPGNPMLGVMLPYSPLHHLLMHAGGGAPLVMTSGNRSDEPIAFEDDDAFRRLKDVADVFLAHNRPIRVRCEDSVTRVINERESPIRRSRGYAPLPISLPFECPTPILAVGGQMKATFALGRDRHAFVSHHLGDLDHLEASRAFVRDVALYENLFALQPQGLVHDLHPDYVSTRYAQRRGAEQTLLCLPVQHHHAHLASCMAENKLTKPVIGVIWDGTGLGTDGAVWGGEILVGDYRQFRRAAHLRYVPMPGSEQAIREPWRMALAHLHDAHISDAVLDHRVRAAKLRGVRQMLERGLNANPTSSAGRMFDAVASLAGVRDFVSFEGQAAIELEALAANEETDVAYPFTLLDGEKIVVDTRPLIAAVHQDVVRGADKTRIGRRFHTTLVQIIVDVCVRTRETTGLNDVVLSGGVFMNALLSSEASRDLRDRGFAVYTHQLVPPNDGGLCLGQLAIGAHFNRFSRANSRPV